MKSSSLYLCIVCLLVAVTTATGAEKFRVEGLLDAEYWNTRGESRLLSINDDDPAGLGRLRLWAIGEFTSSLQGFVMGELVGGDANYDGETETELEQAFLRYSFQSHGLMLEAGKMVMPIGNFSSRYLSSQNPLIAPPGAYDTEYPLGIKLSARTGMVDYMAAVIDRPYSSQDWVTESDPSPRPAVEVGVTPMVGMRFAGFATSGSYMGEEADDFLAAGEGWRDFEQFVYGLDVKFSRGYFEFNGEWTRSTYDAPVHGNLRGTAYYVEPKYTFTPRLFTALRFERNDYPFIMPLFPGVWVGSGAKYSALEAAVGYRPVTGLIVKGAYRTDRWHERDRSFYPDGNAFSVQFSYSFDVNSWFRRPL